MKKIIFGLLATVLFVSSGNAQNGSFSKSAMVVVVAAAKNTFTKGMSYKDWLTAQIGNAANPTKEEDEFLNDVYGFVSTNANSETILKNYDGQTLLDLVMLSNKGGLKVIHEGNISSDRWCIPCLIKLVVDLVCTVVDCTQPVIPNHP